MVLRIVPWPLPTIPGQATNESGGGDVSGVEYLNLDNVAVSMAVQAHTMNAQGKPNDAYIDTTGPFVFTVSGAEVIDITGMSVIEEFKTEVLNGTSEYVNDTSYTINVQPMSFAYSVGANVNRESRKKFQECKIQSIRAGVTRDTGQFYFYKRNSKNINCKGTVTIKVVNAMGVVLQQKVITKDMEVVYE